MPRARKTLALHFACFFACLGFAFCNAQPCCAATNWTWIWANDGTRPPETIFFRQRFTLPRAPVSATLLITADDTCTAYLNEIKKPVAESMDWTTVQEINVTRYLKAGENLLAIQCRNTGGPGGLLYKLRMRFSNGKTLALFSDAQVKVNRRPPPLWNTFALNDSAWPSAKEIAPANGGVWGPLRGAPQPDPTRIVRLWDIHAGSDPNADPYARPRTIGDRMLLSSSVSSASDMKILSKAGFTLFQTDSDHLSTEEIAPGRWNFQTADAARQTVQKLGLDWSYFPHYAFPPKWRRDQGGFIKIQCLEHQQTIPAFSAWDATWPDFIGEGYGALAKQFGSSASGRVNALNVGIHGDYGESGFFMGARVSVEGQREDWQRRFGNLHDHIGFWCGDPQARQDFRNAMLAKYGSLSALNSAWKRDFRAASDIAFPDHVRGEAKQEWLDFTDWYQSGIGSAIEANLGAARKRFPDTLLMLPAGFSDRDPRGSADNSLIARTAAKFKAAVRSTHGGYRPFAENAASMFGSLGSASRFYNAPFWTEPPGTLTANEEVGRIFEAVSQGAAGYFDWSSNALANRDVFYRYGKFLRVEKPVVDVAMFFPAEANHLRVENGVYQPPALFDRACAYVRDYANFDVVDDRMVLDGCLSNYRILALWEGTQADAATLDKIRQWVNDGGVLLAYDFGKVTTFDGDTSWFKDLFGYVQELAPARLNERYVGNIPRQYGFLPGQIETGDFLNGDWYEPDKESPLARWTGANATVLLPVLPEKSYTLVVRAAIPSEAAALKHEVLINGRSVGELASSGEVVYRFVLPDGILDDKPLATLSFQSQTYQPSKTNEASKDTRLLGAHIFSIQLVEQGETEAADILPPPGLIRRELEVRRLNAASNQSWARIYGKGLTIYFPANRQLLKGYVEVLRRAIYHLSSIDPARRDALRVDDDNDGVYATLLTDKVLYYNPKDSAVTKKVSIPAAAFAAWKGEVAIPTDTNWTLKLEPHSIGAIYFTPPSQELLYECEKFTDLGGLKPTADARCSPGIGASCVLLLKGAAISTRFALDTPGRYAIYTRCLRNGSVEPADVLIDNVAFPAVNRRVGQTLFVGYATLPRGTHTLTLRARSGQDVRADFVLLSNDPTVAGYDFAVRTAPLD